MKFEIERSFRKDFKKVKNPQLASIIKDVIINVGSADEISDIVGIKKLTLYQNAYQIKKGDYRIGVFIIDNVVEFTAFAHRKDIYKKFP